MVFWDDNPLERNKIKKFLPEVFVVEPDKEIINWPEQLDNLDIFSKIKVTKEDKRKLEQYKIRSKFLDQKTVAKDEIKYLKSIKLKPKMINLNKDNIARASQMTLKTNQFNLRTKRYSISEIQKFGKSKEYTVKLIQLSDLYGDHGIVGLIILKKLNNSSIFIDTFLISCRVFGRYLETWMLYQLKRLYKKNNSITIYGELLITEKNKQICERFLTDHSFKKLINKNKFFKSYQNIFFSKIDKILNKNIKIYDK